MQKPISFKIDTVIGNTYDIPKNIRKGDTLTMTIGVFQDGANLNLTGQTIHIIIRKSDGYSVDMRSGTATSYLSSSENQIVAIFKDDYIATSAVGITIGEIHLIDSTGDDITNHFIFEVGESLADDVVIKSEDKIDTLLEIDALIDSYNENADNLAIQNTLALQHETTLTTINNTSNTLSERLENDILIGTPLAVRLEDDITNGITLAERLETDMTSGTQVAIRVENAVVDGNEVISELHNVNWPVIQSYIDLMNTLLNGMTITDENNVDITDEINVVITM